jgi:hypothetical protein
MKEAEKVDDQPIYLATCEIKNTPNTHESLEVSNCRGEDPGVCPDFLLPVGIGEIRY